MHQHDADTIVIVHPDLGVLEALNEVFNDYMVFAYPDVDEALHEIRSLSSLDGIALIITELQWDDENTYELSGVKFLGALTRLFSEIPPVIGYSGCTFLFNKDAFFMVELVYMLGFAKVLPTTVRPEKFRDELASFMPQGRSRSLLAPASFFEELIKEI